MNNKLFLTITLIIGLLVLITHTYKLDTLGKGLYVDESSIGINAASIFKTLRDEHGYLLPLYFKSFGDYRGPIYVYTVAILFKVLGVSTTTLRLTSFLFFLTAYILFLLLIKKLFPNDKFIFLFSMLTLGFLPQYFTLSRTSFEVISQLTLISGFIYLFNSQSKNQIFMSGLVLATSIYTYNTTKLLAPLIFLTTIIVFYTELKGNILRFSIGFFIGLIPFLILLKTHPEIAIDQRFKKFSQIEQSTNIVSRVKTIYSNYIQALDPVFLVVKGDPNTRHHTQYGGLIYKTIYLLFLYEIGYSIYKKKIDKQSLYFLILFFLSLLSGAITQAPYHSLRSFLAGISVIMISVYGMYHLPEYKNRIVHKGLICLLIVEISLYQYNYFTVYPTRSIQAFESSGFVEAFYVTRALGIKNLIISEKTNQPYAHYKFYDQTENIDKDLIVKIGPLKPVENSCILYIPENKPKLDDQSIGWKYNDYTEADWYYTLRCY